MEDSEDERKFELDQWLMESHEFASYKDLEGHHSVKNTSFVPSKQAAKRQKAWMNWRKNTTFRLTIWNDTELHTWPAIRRPFFFFAAEKKTDAWSQVSSYWENERTSLALKIKKKMATEVEVELRQKAKPF